MDYCSRFTYSLKGEHRLPGIFKAAKRSVYPLANILLYHINCGVIQGFPALGKAITTRVKKLDVFHVFNIVNQLLTHD